MEEGKIKKNGEKRFWVGCFASCGADELATELVFSNLLKGEKPDEDGFKKVREMIEQRKSLTNEDSIIVKIWNLKKKNG